MNGNNEAIAQLGLDLTDELVKDLTSGAKVRIVVNRSRRESKRRCAQLVAQRKQAAVAAASVNEVSAALAALDEE
ncbi:hypothetical protein PI124_g13636 [Phytophthora idaei]|nr:hypothetical protein PI125_g20076 [Phytophthora idaei]KAG3130405.1 hypothetical protein PI126_g20525 [Phytophthora idaei]KAG3241508.1 hypothetical protein PI124_g13636 [Phytophthora idaei]